MQTLKAVSIILWFVVCGVVSPQVGAQNSADSLRAALRRADTDSLQALLTYQLGVSLMRKAPDSVWLLSQDLIRWGEERNDPTKKREAYHLRAAVSYFKGDYAKARKNWQKALEIVQLEKDPAQIASLYNNLGLVLERQNKEDSALLFYQRALGEWERTKNWQQYAVVMNNMGMLYKRQQDYHKALQCHQQALTIRDTIRDKYLSSSYLNLGELYALTGEREKAYKHYQQALRLKKAARDTWGMALTYHHLGKFFQEKEQTDSAFFYFQKGLELASSIKSESLEVELLRGLAQTYFTEGNYPEAIRTAEQARKKIAGDQLHLLEVTKVLFESHQALGNYQEAYNWHRRYKAASDSIFTRSKSREIGKLETSGDLLKIEREQAVRDAEINAAYQATLIRQERRQWLLMGGILTILVFAVLLYRGYRTLSWKNRLLKKRDQELKALNAKLDEQVRERIKQLEDYAHMNAHNVRGPLARIRGLAYLFAIPQALSESEKKEMAGRIYQSAEELDAVVRSINKHLTEEYERKAPPAPPKNSGSEPPDRGSA